MEIDYVQLLTVVLAKDNTLLSYIKNIHIYELLPKKAAST